MEQSVNIKEYARYKQLLQCIKNSQPNKRNTHVYFVWTQKMFQVYTHRVVHARKLTVNSCTQEFSFTVSFLICFHVGMVIDCILDCIKLWKHVPLVFYHLCRAVSEMAEILLVWKCGVPCLYKCIELIFTGQTAL